MPESRVRIGFPGGSQNNAVIRFQRDSDDDGDFDDIDILKERIKELEEDAK